ncbi:MAG: hypothetical protein Q8R28_15975, partial [Dehalococcoidia bacterium]|nr:hypothetical protein [Dehalococcoidia bacterium]
MSEEYRLWIVWAPCYVDLGEGLDYQGDDDDGKTHGIVRTYVKATDAEAAALRTIPGVTCVETAWDKTYPDYSFGSRGAELNVSDGGRRWEHG